MTEEQQPTTHRLTSLPDDATPEQVEQHRHRQTMQRIADQRRYERRQAEWASIRQWAYAQGFTTFKHYDLLHPSGVLIEISQINPRDCEIRIYSTNPDGRQPKLRVTLRFDGEEAAESTLPHVQRYVHSIQAAHRVRKRRNRK